MLTPDDGLADLRRYAEEVQRGKRAEELRDEEILRLRDGINPATGKPWTWAELSVAAELTRQGAMSAGKRLANKARRRDAAS